MNNKNSLKTVLFIMGATLTIVLGMMAVIPFLNHIFRVEIIENELPTAVQVIAPDKPENILVTAVYQMEEESKKISAIYIEIFHVGSSQVFLVEIPADTKVNLSEKLYKSLQTYAPELPQYLKLSNMTEWFSMEYGLTAGNRILSEVLGISLEHYVRADKETLQSWFALQAEEKTSVGFFEDYTVWLERSKSDVRTEGRWMYYESWRQVSGIQMETAPGSREKDGFLISGKRSGERLQELIASVPQNGSAEENKEK